MRQSIRLESLAAVLIIVGCLGCSKAPSEKPAEEAEKVKGAEELKKAQELKKKLGPIRVQNVGKGTDWAKLEAECLELTRDFNSPANLGRIYATIAGIYSDAGFTSKDVQLPKTIEYAKKALEYPLDVPTQCHMYGRWGDVLFGQAFDGPKEDMALMRREAIVPILRGLKIALDHNAPKESQNPPPVHLFDIGGPKDSPAYQRMVKKHEEQLAARKKVDLLNTLYSERWALTQRCITLYSQEPYDTAELIDLASEILPEHKDAVDDLVAEVKAAIAKKEKSAPQGPSKE